MSDEDGPRLGSEYSLADDPIARAAALAEPEPGTGGRLARLFADLQAANKRAREVDDEARTAKIERDRALAELLVANARISRLDATVTQLQAALEQAAEQHSKAWVRSLQRMVVEDPDLTLEMADALCTNVGVSWTPPTLVVRGRVNFEVGLQGISPRAFDPDRPQDLAGETLYIEQFRLGGYHSVGQTDDGAEAELLIDKVTWNYE